ncbi:hypothetical protein G7Y89_g13493 [Cudoniella acicularis]|uniref:Uncharacterized protein n=1 Tax=Cudoniella acicularis TaxID=354080 RepID=A0A8H4R6T4_9HELO|nr:hypothetical protein G7Y89_g13493 [Cudoniella acicularis]
MKGSPTPRTYWLDLKNTHRTPDLQYQLQKPHILPWIAQRGNVSTNPLAIIARNHSRCQPVLITSIFTAVTRKSKHNCLDSETGQSLEFRVTAQTEWQECALPKRPTFASKALPKGPSYRPVGNEGVEIQPVEYFEGLKIHHQSPVEIAFLNIVSGTTPRKPP